MPSQLAPLAWVGSGSFTASALTVEVLTPIQEDQGTPGEAGDLRVPRVPQSPPGHGIELTGGRGTTWHDDLFSFCLVCDPKCTFEQSPDPPPFFSPSLFMLKKKTRLSLSQSFLFANISKVNGCGACGFS